MVSRGQACLLSGRRPRHGPVTSRGSNHRPPGHGRRIIYAAQNPFVSRDRMCLLRISTRALVNEAFSSEAHRKLCATVQHSAHLLHQRGRAAAHLTRSLRSLHEAAAASGSLYRPATTGHHVCTTFAELLSHPCHVSRNSYHVFIPGMDGDQNPSHFQTMWSAGSLRWPGGGVVSHQPPRRARAMAMPQ
jgi:hypothetical protein